MKLSNIRLGALSALMACSLAAHAGQLVVISSSADAIVPGDIVDGAALMEIPAEATVTLVAPDGRVVSLKGPYQAAPDKSANPKDVSLLDSLARLFAGKSGEQLAVFRSAPTKGPDPWAANVTRSGTYCLRTDRPATLWRTRARLETRLTLELTGSGQKVSVRWPAGESTLPWPSALPLIDGANYFAHLKNAIGSTEITPTLVPSGLPGDVHRAAWMGRNGCARQARKVLEALARAAR